MLCSACIAFLSILLAAGLIHPGFAAVECKQRSTIAFVEGQARSGQQWQTEEFVEVSAAAVALWIGQKG